MYPESVAAPFGPLAPYVMGPISPSELHSGLLSEDLLKSFDTHILKLAAPVIDDWVAVDITETAKNPNSKWRLASCLQKAIRFGLPEMAAFAASMLVDIDLPYLRKRIMVIAAEDVTAGNLFTVATALAAGGNAAWRKERNERRFFVWLAHELAAHGKDRLLIDALVWARADKTFPVAEAAKWESPQLVATAIEAADPRHRLMAAWLLAGTARYGEFGMPEDNFRHPDEFLRLLVDAHTTRFGYWMAQRIRSRTGVLIFIPVILADAWLREGWEPGVIERVPPNQEKVGKLLGAAYDMYTREGKAALTRWFKKPELRRFVEAAKAKDRTYLMHEGTFLAEGGVLNRQVRYGDMDAVVRQVCISENAFADQLPPELAAEFLPTLVEHLPELNDVRAEVLAASLG